MNTINPTNANAATDTTPRNVDCGESCQSGSDPLSLLPPDGASTPEPADTPSSEEVQNPQSSPIVDSQKIRSPQSPIGNRVIDTWDIPFPKSLAELHALDATREIPYLKALCNRRQIHTPCKNPTPAEIIPIIQARLDHHLTLKPKGLSEIADIMVEWKLIHDDLAEFLTQLKNLCPPSSALSVSCSVLIPKPANTPYPSRQAPRHYNNSPQKISPPSSVPKLPITNSQSPITNPSLDSTTPTPRHSQPSSATPPKTPAISNPQTEPSKTFGHSQALPQKISSAPKSRTQTHAQPPTKIPDPQFPIPDQQPSPLPNPKRRIPDLLSTLSAQTKQSIIAFCEETSSYKEAAQKILHHLNLKISPASLSKLYTNYGIADDQQTRDEIIAAHENQNPNPIPRDQIIRATAKNQLELRLLELSARRDHDHGQLKELFQIITRLEALALSERRVLLAERRIQLAEKRDQRQTQPPPPQPSLNPLQIKRAVRISLGKSTDDIDAELARQAAAPAAMQTDSEQDQNEIIALCTKHLLGKEITLGDELIAEPDPSTIQTTHLTSHTTSCTHLT